ncbi:MAG: cryptochrome/photolyase family protein [Planctomycetota bacterium]|nr:cryptochrome/photolyase family protein [Planctomycetota bacterium]
MDPDQGAIMSSLFHSLLRNDSALKPKRWLWVAHDQLHSQLNPWAGEPPEETGLIFVESKQRGNVRPYHRQKLAFLLSNLRHRSLEAQQEGHPVRYLISEDDYGKALTDLAQEIGTIHVLRSPELEIRQQLKTSIAEGLLREHEHGGWLTTREEFLQSVGDEPPFRMDVFYRHFRKISGVLMENSSPEGGKYSHDGENRKPWKGTPPAPSDPTFEVDAIDKEVTAMIMEHFPQHPGNIDLRKLPTTAQQAQQALDFARSVIPEFGPYEDAFSESSRGLFHTRLASLMHLHRVLPEEVLTIALESSAPLNSREGLIRQLVWREYMHHIHEITDGFRTIDVPRSPAACRDARWGDVSGGKKSISTADLEEHPNRLKQEQPLPPAYWGKESGLRCLDATTTAVMEDGWTHHIPRLMILGNLASLLDIHPRELTDWFHVAFIDAYDWVVETNVLGMGTFAVGESMMTKPYVSGTPYIQKMGDHCQKCSFHPKKTCPISKLYWAFLERHGDAFEGNVRMAMPLRTLSRRSEDQKAADVEAFEWVSSTLSRGEVLHPD